MTIDYAIKMSIIGMKIVLGDSGSVYEHYDTLSDKARSIHGQRTVTFMQIGDFFEAYFKPDSSDASDMLLLELSEQFLMSRSIKSNGLYMMGFPLASEERYIDAFLAKGWSVCIVDQIMDTSFENFENTSIIDATNMTDKSFHDANNKGRAKRKVLYRIVRAVYTPGSHEDATDNVNNVVCVSYYTSRKMISDVSRGKTYIGVCCMELKTGRIIVHQFASDPKNANYLNESLYKFITENTPKEIRIYTNSNLVKDYFEGILRREVTVCSLPDTCMKVAYREGVLWQTYKDIIPRASDLQVSLHTYMNILDVEYAAAALVLCINYISSTNRALLQRVSVPDLTSTKDILSIHYNASEQLNLIDSKPGRFSSLFKVINETITDIGVYSLHQLHTKPYTNPDTLNARYNAVDYLMKSPDIITELSGLLVWMKSVARLQSKFAIGKIDNVSLYKLLMCYTHFEKLHTCMLATETESKIACLNPADFTQFQCMLNDFRMSVSEEILKSEKCDFIDSVRTLSDLGSIGDLILDTIIVTDTEKMALLREYTAELKTCIDQVNTFVSELENNIKSVKGKCTVGYIRHISVKYIRKCGTACFCIQTTEIGKKHLAEFSSRRRTSDFESTRKTGSPADYTVSASKDSKTKFDIHTPETDTLLHKIHRLMYCILGINEYFTRKLVHVLYTRYTCMYQKILDVISNIDILVSFAKVSLKYNYCKPTAVHADASFVTATDLRHPLLERVLYDNGTCAYVPNDISIGAAGAARAAGMLLYSMNGVGKSSLMKSIGSAVYMAQLGCYTPANTFTFAPFHRIMTRIDSSDDMFQGMSSFAKEITELSSIVLQADNRTLVLADEICRGTESDSAYAITAATIEYLCSRGSAFVVSSHIHEISDSDILRGTSGDKIRICHLNVIEGPADEAEGTSIKYTRKLMDGKCKSLYGVEIARVLGYPTGILARAEAYRDEKLRRISEVIGGKCVYNKNFYENECLRCGNEEKDNLDTHHVIPQHSANEQGYITTVNGNKIHKDDASNLVRLCKRCHREFHNKGTFRIETVPKARRVIHYTVDTTGSL